MEYKIYEINNIAAYELDEYLIKWKNFIMLIDVRDENKYENCHIEGAINVPYKHILENKIELPHNKIIVIYCDRGGLSMTISRYLQKRGYRITNVIGGINNYRKNLK